MLKLPFKAPALAGAINGSAPRRSGGGVIGLLRRRLPLVIIGVVLLGGGGYVAAAKLTTPPPAVPQRTMTVQRGTLVSTVTSTGTVAALAQSKLTFASSGRVAEVLVKQGDAVKKDQPLARLDPVELQLAVTQQKAALSTAEAKLATIKAGSRAEDIKAAQIQLDAAQAKLAAMQAGGRAEDVASAKASLDSARAQLNQLKNPSDADVKAAEQAVASAQSGLETAQTSLNKLKNGPTAEDVKNAQLAIDQAKNSLWSQQTSRDGTCGRDQNSYQCKSADTSVASAETGVTKAQNDLAKLQAPATADDLASAEKSVASAQAQLTAAQSKLTQLKAGGSPDQLAQAQSAVTSAELALTLKQKPYTDADIQAQKQAVAAAEAGLVAKQTPYTDADVQSAQASIDQAKASLALAQRSLDNATLTAAFDGVVGAVALNVGEASGSNTITLVNPKDIRLDVTIDETDIAKIQAGQKTTVTFDSIANKTFPGAVTAVAPSAVIASGVATYSVSISLPNDPQVRPGMTGNANIVFGEKANALLVPNRAVRTQGRNRVVEVVSAKAPADAGAPATTANLPTEMRTVKVGLANDQMTEITDGLAEGDQVVIPTTTSAAVGGAGGGRGPVVVGPGGGPGR